MNQWLIIEAQVAGKEISGVLDGRPCLRFTAPQAVSGYVGLWSKGDTTAYFRKLETDDAPSPLNR
jgi:pyruvate, water dikinase